MSWIQDFSLLKQCAGTTISVPSWKLYTELPLLISLIYFNIWFGDRSSESLSLRNCMLFLSHPFTVTLPTSSKKECCNAQAPTTHTNNSITWSWLQAVAISPPSCSKGPTLGQWGPNPASCLLNAHPCKRSWESQCNDQCWIHGYPFGNQTWQWNTRHLIIECSSFYRWFSR